MPWMPAGQFSMGCNSVNQKQCLQKYVKALVSARYFHNKIKFATLAILESETLKNDKKRRS